MLVVTILALLKRNRDHIPGTAVLEAATGWLADLQRFGHHAPVASSLSVSTSSLLVAAVWIALVSGSSSIQASADHSVAGAVTLAHALASRT